MSTYYLKNTSGSDVPVADLGLLIPTNASIVIDSNNINGYLTADMATRINAGSLILSTTDVGDNGGDMSIANAINALSLVSKGMTNNPTLVTFTQAVDADPNTDITAEEAETLTDGSDAGSLHIHDARYWTKTLLEGSNSGTVKINWENIINAPTFGAMQWIEPVACTLNGMDTTPPSSPQEGWFYLNTSDKHIYKYVSGSWVDQGAPVSGNRVIFRDGAASDDYIYEYDGSAWNGTAPVDNWATLVEDDGDGHAAQYIYADDEVPPDWIKLADVNWGDHDILANRDSAGSHPASAISFSNSTSGLAATTVQDALDELSSEYGVDISNVVYVAKNGSDTFTGGTQGTIANPFATIQAAVNYISDASSTNRYAVYIMAGDYAENVVLNKAYVYITGVGKSSTRIKSSSGTTVTCSSTSDETTGISNISIVSESSSTTDNALLITGNNPIVQNVQIVASSGARGIYINGAYNQTLDSVVVKNGEVRIDAGIIKLNNSYILDGQLNITNGTVFIHQSEINYNGGNAIEQSNGTIYLVSAKLASGSSSYDYNQSAGTVYWGWVEYNPTKVQLNGTKTLLFYGQDLFYSNSTSGMSASNVQTAIDELDSRIDATSTNLSNHIGDTTNPHSTTLTQAISEDSAADADLTVVNLNALVDDSNADALHTHAASNISFSNIASGLSATTVQAALDEIVTEYDISIDNIRYVAKNGSDSATGVVLGTFANPYLTVQTAINSISDASSAKPYVVFVMPGRYQEDLTLKPYVNIVGMTPDATLITTNSGTHTATFESGGRIELRNVSLGSAAQNFVGTHPASAPNGTSMTFNNVVLGTATFNMLGGAVDYVQFRNDFYCGGLVTIHSANLTAYNGTFFGGILLDDAGCEHVDSYGSASSNTIKDCSGADLTCEGNVWAEFYNNYSWTNLTADGANCTISYDAQSAPDTLAQLISLNGGNFARTDNAFAIGYNHTTSGLAASDVQSAIDEISSKISETISKGTVFPASPDAGDLYYRTDLSLFFQYDGTRSTWLSLTQMFLDWGSSSADGVYLNIHGAAATQTGYLMPRNGRIISITARCASGNQSKALEVRRNHNSTTPLASFSLASGSYTSITDNVSFASGDYIQVFAQSNSLPARDLVVLITVAWTA